MNNHAALNHQEHANLRVTLARAKEFGDGINSVMVFPIEFRDVQARYPIFFHKQGDTGEFYPLALLGFEQGENLFLKEGVWDTTYMPMMVEKQPLYIGFQSDDQAPEGKSMLVTIDLDSPRITESGEQDLFNGDGSPTDYLQRQMDLLERVHQGHEHSKKFVAALLELDLIEPFSMEITLADGSSNQMLGYYTLNEEKLQTLTGDQMARLSQDGFLVSAFMIVASHSQLGELVHRKNKLKHASHSQ